jgi:guanylate kinase
VLPHHYLELFHSFETRAMGSTTRILQYLRPQLQQYRGYDVTIKALVGRAPLWSHHFKNHRVAYPPFRAVLRRDLSLFKGTSALHMALDKTPRWKTDDVAGSHQKLDVFDDKDQYVLVPLVVCGPSGVGTRAIIKRFLMKHEDKFAFVISHTNRKPRRDEENGIDYHFVSDKEMEEMIFWEELLEHANVLGNIYGLAYQSIFEVHASGGPPRREIMDIDVQGVKKLKEIASSLAVESTGYKLRPKYVFIAPPDLETLKYRLMVRNTESEEEILRRLEVAEQEMLYGMSKAFHAVVYHVDLEQAVRDFTDTVARLYDSFAIALSADLDSQDPEDHKLFRRTQRSNLVASLQEDVVNPVDPEDSRLMWQAHRNAWGEIQKKNKAEGKPVTYPEADML